MCFTQWVLFPTNIWNYLFTVQVSSVGSMFDGRFEFINIKIPNIIMIFFLNLACFIPDVVHCWLEIYTYGIKILLNQIEAQIWHDITWVDQKVIFFFKTCQFLYLVKTFSAGFLLSEKLLDCNRFSSFFSLWFTLHLKIPKCASHSG